jgi:quercetin dioxygenase-like cupin family protein
LPEVGSAPTWFARFSNGSGNIGRVERYGVVYVLPLGYTLVNHDDPSVESFRGAFFKMRRALGVTAFGINEVRLPPGATGVEHDESDIGHEEVYVVTAGAGTFTIDGEAVDVASGDYLRVDPQSNRVVVGGEDGITFVVVGARSQDEYDGRASL